MSYRFWTTSEGPSPWNIISEQEANVEVARTVEMGRTLRHGTILADYDAQGLIVGLELLSGKPCQAQLGDQTHRVGGKEKG